MPCSPGMRACKTSCAHRAFVREYQSERMRQEADLDARSLGYASEAADLIARGEASPPVTFHEWLIQTRGWSGRE